MSGRGKGGGKGGVDRKDLYVACFVTALVTLAVMSVIFCVFMHHQRKKLDAMLDRRESGVVTGNPLRAEEEKDNIEMNQYGTRPTDI